MNEFEAVDELELQECEPELPACIVIPYFVDDNDRNWADK